MSLIAIPRAKGAVPGLGHIPRLLLRGPLAVLRSLHAEGPVVRLHIGTMPIVVVTSADTVIEVMRLGKAAEKGRLFKQMRPVVGNGLASSDGPEHIRNRRLIQPMFYKERIAGYAAVMGEKAETLAGSWSAGQRIDVDQVMGAYAIETLAATLFSADIGRPAVESVREDLPVIMRNMLLRALAPQFTVNWPIWKKFNKSAERMRLIIDEVISKTRAADVDSGTDLLSLLLATRDEETGEGLTDEEIRDELTTMLFAGTETVASTLSWALHHLAEHPDVERELLDEIDAVAGDRAVTFADVPKLPSVTRVLDEVIRLHGVVTLMRTTTAPVTVGGYELPVGTELLFSLYALHRSPELYPDPDRFDPDRWLPEQADQRPRDHVVPFGAGNRKCIGDKFAWLEAAITLATILRRWELRPTPGSKPPTEATASMAHPTRMPMIVQPRRGH